MRKNYLNLIKLKCTQENIYSFPYEKEKIYFEEKKRAELMSEQFFNDITSG